MKFIDKIKIKSVPWRELISDDELREMQKEVYELARQMISNEPPSHPLFKLWDEECLCGHLILDHKISEEFPELAMCDCCDCSYEACLETSTSGDMVCNVPSDVNHTAHKVYKAKLIFEKLSFTLPVPDEFVILQDEDRIQ